MKKTLLLALAFTTVSLAGCADETPAEVDTTVIETPAQPVDPMMADTTAMMDDGAMMADTTGTMDAAPMEGETMPADTATTGM